MGKLCLNYRKKVLELENTPAGLFRLLRGTLADHAAGLRLRAEFNLGE
jgi:hypothetical protein